MVLLCEHFPFYYTNVKKDVTNKENIFSGLEISKAEALLLEKRMREAEEEREELEEAQRKANEARRIAEEASYLEKAERELKVIL